MAKGVKGHEWTEAEDKLIREMLEQGESVVNICDRIGVDYVDMKNHLYTLRKADPTFPRCVKRGRAGTDEMLTHEMPSVDGISGSGKGELNALEAAMAEQIKELTEENGDLATKNAELAARNAKLAEQVAELTRQRDELEARREDFNKEFEDGVSYYTAQLALSEDMVHSQIDRIAELVEERRTLEAELARTRQIVTELCGRFVLA